MNLCNVATEKLLKKDHFIRPALLRSYRSFYTLHGAWTKLKGTFLNY